MKPLIHSMAPYGRTGGRVYLRMIHDVTADQVEWRTVPDYKRTYGIRRGRKLRHLARLAPLIRSLADAPGHFLWDDLSLLHFTPEMRARTIFVLHHYEPLQADSWPVEPLLWRRLFSVLPQCRAVVCVAPYWADFLRERGVDNVHVIYNAFDLTEIDHVRGMDAAECKQQFGLPEDEITVYAGKAVHWKGTETVADALREAPGIRVVTTGSNTIGFSGHHYDLPRAQYLRLLRACDVGVFTPRMREGWSRCAAEALLVGVPSLIRPVAGLTDLAHLTAQPAPDLAQLAAQVRTRAACPPEEIKTAYDALARYDLEYFEGAWTSLLAQVTTS
ncbi:glycosyltransferase family 4 protein [Streptomyces sp. TRM66268-LWL]|uniref:Glycosyltransferase family 4 protein n=1 Tax=Streptomyces polyasparticus TaxID=2767826 RepID=A0ABR7SQQ3_9ACTN|nr:glycosyltransferase [Streptomyces polyasparticus]MBC9717826.1 glycosyltransferase family 4 protein [Streptomyces polyasparticus]